MLRKLTFLILLFKTVIFALNISTVNLPYISYQDYREKKELIVIWNDSCLIKINNKTNYYKKCNLKFKFTPLENLNFIIYFYKNNTLFKKEHLTIKSINLSYSIENKVIKAGDKAIINLYSSNLGFLKIKNIQIPINKGNNTINLLDYIKKLPYGKVPIEIEICYKSYCKKYKDFLYFESSPYYCDIRLLDNNFPYYVKFNFEVKDQRGRNYHPKNVFFDMKLLPFFINDSYIIYFPKFYKAQNFLIKIIVDSKTCTKNVSLNYSKFFYSVYDTFEKKLGLARVILINPYKEEVNLTLIYKNNKSIKVNLRGFQETILKLPFSNYSIKYNNVTIYNFSPKLVKNNFLDKLTSNMAYFVLYIFILIFIFNLILVIFSKFKIKK